MVQKPDNTNRKRELEALEKRGAERRQESAEHLAKHKENKQVEDAARAERQHIAAKEEEKRAAEREEVLAEWRKEEKERLKEVEKTKKQKEEQMKLLEQKKKSKIEAEKHQKEYMKNLEHASRLARMKDRRKHEARVAKEESTQEADATVKRRKELLNQSEALEQRHIEQTARKDRGDVEVQEHQLLSSAEEEFTKKLTKIRTKEQSELSALQLEFNRKRSILPSITDTSLRRRTADEIDRDEKKQKDRIAGKYQKMTTDVSIERTKRLDDIRTTSKKDRDTISQNERQKSRALQRQSDAQRAEADREFARKMKDAKKLEDEILHMTFEEMAAEEKARTQKTSVKMDENEQDQPL